MLLYFRSSEVVVAMTGYGFQFVLNSVSFNNISILPHWKWMSLSRIICR